MTNFEKHLKSKLRDKKFVELFEKERCQLKISYEMMQLRKKKKRLDVGFISKN